MDRGFTLIELLIVIAILAVLSVAVVWKTLNVMPRCKKTAALTTAAQQPFMKSALF